MDLTERTTIPLWALFSAIPIIAASVTWISFIAYTSSASAAKIEQIEQRLKEKEHLLYLIKEDVAIIKVILEKSEKREGR